MTLVFLYNFARFGNFFESGYSFQIVPDDASRAREYGIFSLVHVPGNLYYFLLATPLLFSRDGISHVLKFPYFFANPWGMSIFLTSPYIVYLFLLKYKTKITRLLLLTSLVISIPIFLFFGIGHIQFGYRYSLDFLPLLFLILMIGIKENLGKLCFGLKLTFLITALSNLFLFLTLYFWLNGSFKNMRLIIDAVF